jgi:hypothetical protein
MSRRVLQPRRDFLFSHRTEFLALGLVSTGQYLPPCGVPALVLKKNLTKEY